MELTVLGSSASYAGAGQACAGYLVRDGDASLLLDCGHGVVANLAHVMDPIDLDGVAISHAHPDHIVDIYALQALLRYAPQGPAPELGLWAPRGLLDRMSCLLSDRGGQELARAFESIDLSDRATFDIGGLSLTSHRVDHSAESFAFEVRAGGGRLVYTGDTRPAERLVDLARGADVLLADATLPDGYAGRAPHMTATQAGELASAAEVGTLILTHVWPTNDRGRMVEQARERYDGDVRLASELLAIEIG